MIYYLDLFGVFVFAISGALAAGRKDMDYFGVMVLALVTSTGGGTFRDLVLGITPVFWVRDPSYLMAAAAGAAVTLILAKAIHRARYLLQLADAFGLALFTAIGTLIALDAGVSGVIAVVMGVMTGVVGGVIRDLLSGVIPLVLRREIYAMASLAGAVILVVLVHFELAASVALWAAFGVTLTVRLVAMRWHLSAPTFAVAEWDQES